MPSKDKYARLVQLGRCPICGKPLPQKWNLIKCQDCRDRASARFADRAKMGLCGLCGDPRGALATKTLCRACADKACESELGIKRQVMGHYGGKCVRCQVDDIDVLTIDHIKNDGALQRRHIGARIYRWIVKHNFPDDLQILCANCNLKKKLEYYRALRRGTP